MSRSGGRSPGRGIGAQIKAARDRTAEIRSPQQDSLQPRSSAPRLYVFRPGRDGRRGEKWDGVKLSIFAPRL